MWRTLGGSRRRVTMIVMMMIVVVITVVSVHRGVVHAFTPVVVTTSTTRQQQQQQQPQPQRSIQRSTVAWRMSDPTAAVDNDDSTMDDRNSMNGVGGPNGITAPRSRTSTVFLLTPDDPIASLSASPYYTFPTTPRTSATTTAAAAVPPVWRESSSPAAVVATEEEPTPATATTTMMIMDDTSNNTVTQSDDPKVVQELFLIDETTDVDETVVLIATAEAIHPSTMTTTTTTVEDHVVVTDELGSVLDDQEEAGVVLEIPHSLSPTLLVAEVEPRDGTIELSDDEKVVHDLFRLDDKIAESITMSNSSRTLISDDVEETTIMVAESMPSSTMTTTVEDHVVVTNELGSVLDDQEEADVVLEMPNSASPTLLVAEVEPRDGTIVLGDDEKVVHDLFRLDDTIAESITMSNSSRTMTSDDKEETTIMLAESTPSSTMTTTVEDHVVVTNELEQVPKENDDKDTNVLVIAPAMSSATTGSTALAIEKPNDVRATMSEDEKVVNDLFIINDVYGINPITAMETASTNMEQPQVEITGTEHSEPINDDTNKVSWMVDDTVNIDTVDELPLASLSTITEESSDDSASEPHTEVTMLELDSRPSEQSTTSEISHALHNEDQSVAPVDAEKMNEVYENPMFTTAQPESRESDEVTVHSEYVAEESAYVQPIFSEDENATNSDNDVEVPNLSGEPIRMKSAPDDEPFFPQYDDDEEAVVVSELMVKPPSTPPQLSQFAQFQPSIVFALTREERIALAERSFLSLEIKPGVKVETIKGAAIATFVLALLAGDELPIAIFAMVPTVASFAITRGKTGETIRIIGDLSWLWTAKVAETLSNLDASHLITFWNTVQSVTSNALLSFGSWVEQQSRLAEEEYYQNQSAAANIKASQQPENDASEYFFMSTTDQVLVTEIEEVPLSSTISQPDLSFEKELDNIQLLLQEAELERIAAKARCEKKVKESNQRQLLTTKLEMDRRASHMKQLLSERKVAMLQLEEKFAREKSIEAKQRSLLESRLAIENFEKARFTRQEEDIFNKKKAEANQRSLLEARLKFDRQYISIVNESRRLVSEAHKRKSIEAKQRSLLESRLELERLVAVQSKIAAQKAEINARRQVAESKQRSLLESHLSIRKQQMRRAEAEAISRMEKETALAEIENEKRRIAEAAERDQVARMEEQTRLREAENRRIAEAVERDQLAQMEEQTRLREAEKRRIAEAAERDQLAQMEEQTRLREAEKRRIAEAAERDQLAQMEEQARLQEVEKCRIAEAEERDQLAQVEVEKRRIAEAAERDRLPADLFQTEIINPPPKVPTENAPFVDSRSMQDPMETLKPNIVAAKALIESVRNGESYQFRKEWWE